MRHLSSILLLSLVAFGCRPITPVVVSQSPPAPAGIAGIDTVLVMRPILLIEDVDRETPLEADPDEDRDVTREVIDQTSRTLVRHGFQVVAEESLPEEARRQLDTTRQALLSDRESLARARAATRLLTQRLSPLAGLADAAAVYVISVKREVTPRASGYGGNTISVNRATTRLLVALVDLKDPTLVWSNQTFFRGDPAAGMTIGSPTIAGALLTMEEAGEDAFRNAVQLSLETFPRRS